MITREKIKIYLDPELGEGKYTKQGLKYNCPVCSGSNGKYNLEINLDPNSKKYLKFNAWCCTLKGSLKNLFYKYVTDNSWKQNIPELNAHTNYQYEETLKETIDFPKGSFSFSLSKNVKEYLLKTRKLDEKVLKERNVMYCYNKEEKLYNHILFPFYDDNKRMIGFASQNFETKKYKNHISLNFVAYKEFVNWNFPIVLTEGIYDALSGVNAVPLLGTKLSISLLKMVKDKKIILAMDNDKEFSIEEKKKMIDKLYEYGAKTVLLFELEGYKDLNEFNQMNKEEFKFNLFAAFNLLNL